MKAVYRLAVDAAGDAAIRAKQQDQDVGAKLSKAMVDLVAARSTDASTVQDKHIDVSRLQQLEAQVAALEKEKLRLAKKAQDASETEAYLLLQQRDVGLKWLYAEGQASVFECKNRDQLVEVKRLEGELEVLQAAHFELQQDMQKARKAAHTSNETVRELLQQQLEAQVALNAVRAGDIERIEALHAMLKGKTALLAAKAAEAEQLAASNAKLQQHVERIEQRALKAEEFAEMQTVRLEEQAAQSKKELQHLKALLEKQSSTSRTDIRALQAKLEAETAKSLTFMQSQLEIQASQSKAELEQMQIKLQTLAVQSNRDLSLARLQLQEQEKKAEAADEQVAALKEQVDGQMARAAHAQAELVEVKMQLEQQATQHEESKRAADEAVADLTGRLQVAEQDQRSAVEVQERALRLLTNTLCTQNSSASATDDDVLKQQVGSLLNGYLAGSISEDDAVKQLASMKVTLTDPLCAASTASDGGAHCSQPQPSVMSSISPGPEATFSTGFVLEDRDKLLRLMNRAVSLRQHVSHTAARPAALPGTGPVPDVSAAMHSTKVMPLFWPASKSSTTEAGKREALMPSSNDNVAKLEAPQGAVGSGKQTAITSGSKVRITHQSTQQRTHAADSHTLANAPAVEGIMSKAAGLACTFASGIQQLPTGDATYPAPAGTAKAAKLPGPVTFMLQQHDGDATSQGMSLIRR
mmetsp:Transcript_16027/g.34636  ORF Transcript_16027/g.34636 Transcript_16027/m.34636 type:complete len:697 (+) Transcript_16027:144-2234(+)|eukprot:CAMPEP_0202915166 /NCGR_PEP_ID=MMETSP1392-20130828/64983_1 /ASSEMBLY_ACC=CAM_ASM_000868 /TAXON_ID=225041 /ORGANISM="Chlamydomonas chlamydogama, Strain SAG 11-48b" /LENGTH=696 /DNA_ID=CAMNT_0049607085 /DNA_START=41 /DNA_END=2131 /DNA_ORIENTATION=-